MDIFLWGFKQLGNSAAERVKKGACHYLSGAMRQLERVRGGGYSFEKGSEATGVRETVREMIIYGFLIN